MKHEHDPLTQPMMISREVQRARSLAFLVLIISGISLIADTVLAALVGGPWGAGGVIGVLGASLVLCFGPRHGREGNATYSFFMLAMLCAIIFHAFQLYAAIRFWQLWRTEFGDAVSIQATEEIDARHDLVVYTLCSYSSILFSSVCLVVMPWAVLRGARARSAITREIDGPGTV